MDCKSNIERSKLLPFHVCSQFTLSQLVQSRRSKVLETLELNNFSKSMRKHVNGFSKNNYTCGYFDEDSIPNITRKHDPNSLKIFHVNIESFSKKGVELSVYLKCLKFEFDIICLTEIRYTNIGIIDKEFPEFHIFIDNPTTAKGGVAIILKKDKFSQITEIDSSNDFNLKNNCACTKCIIENKWLSCKINNQKIILGGIYRHPKGEIDHFNNALKKSLSNIKNDTLAIILGDFNIDLIKESDPKVNCYLSNYFENNFIPCITLPTRITYHSATLLDHIFIKTPKKFIQNKCSSGNLITDLSDHLPNFSFIDIKTTSIKDRPFIRLFTQTNIEKFIENSVSEPSLISPNEVTEVNSSYNTFTTNYQNLFDKYFPYVRISRKAFKSKPFITRGIKNSIKHRNRLYKKYLDNPNDLNESIWKRFRNKTGEIIKRAEALYYRKIISDHNNSSKNLWNTFGKILNNKKVKHSKIESLNLNGVNLTEPKNITESFNNFFSEIGGNLAKNFPTNDSQFKNYLGAPVTHSMYLRPTSVKEILRTVKSLKNSNSLGHDNFPTKFIKLSATLIAPVLEKIFNLSMKSGVFPDALKVAKVIPIFKKGSPTSINNYRPISVLSPINKIFEKILYSRLIKYIDKSKLLYKYQYGFRKNHSTEHALIELIDQIRLSIGKGQMTCGIFIDLSKAFDTVNHQILLDKLEHYGIRGHALALFKSYLSNRNQYVHLDKCKSQTRPISCGVPQGSVLGPLFFLLFINDLPNCCSNGKIRLFADDTTIFFHTNSIDEVILTGKVIMTELTNWFKANKLTLNTDKSSFTLFKSSKKVIPNIPEHIDFLNQKILRTSHIKFLGVTLDENLTWNQHINEICSKLKRLFHIFYNIRKYLTEDNIKTIYYALVYSRIKYGITVYGQACQTKMQRIQTLQNQLLKVISGKEPRFPTNELHDEFKLLLVKDIANQEILAFVHNYFSNSLPPVFDGYFETLASNHNRNTRNGQNLIRIADHKTNITASATKIQGAKLWNKLDNNLKNITKVKQFKTKYKNSVCLPYVKEAVL